MFPIPRRSGFLLSCCAGVLAAALPAASAHAASRAELDERVRRAGRAFHELRSMPDKRIPAELYARSRCVAVIPNVIKAAWVLGGRYGKGVLSCRSKTGEWSPPVIVMMTGGSFGLQFGASSTDVVLFFMTTESVRSLLANKVKLSGDAGVAAGPVGRETEAATDGRFAAEIYSYARSRGLFAGLSLSGSYLGVNHEDTAAYYGKSYTPNAILFDHKVTSVPKSAWSFLGSLPRPRNAAAARQAPVPAEARRSEPAAQRQVTIPKERRARDAEAASGERLVPIPPERLVTEQPARAAKPAAPKPAPARKETITRVPAHKPEPAAAPPAAAAGKLTEEKIEPPPPPAGVAEIQAPSTAVPSVEGPLLEAPPFAEPFEGPPEPTPPAR